MIANNCFHECSSFIRNSLASETVSKKNCIDIADNN